MSSNRFSLWVTCSVFSLLCMPAFACYSGLIVIPTADMVPEKTYSIEYQTDGTIPHYAADTYLINTEAGITDRFEAGVDYDLDKEADTRVLFNGKFLLRAADEKLPAVAVGGCEIGDKLNGKFYLVATQSFDLARGHVGVQRVDSTNSWFVGADKAIDDKLSVTADYTSGDDNSSSLGASYKLTDTTSVMAGTIFPNAGGDARFTVHFVLTGLLK